MDPIKHKIYVVNVGAWFVSASSESILATYALGSSIGITAWDPITKIGGLFHLILPDSKLHPQHNQSKSITYVEPGLNEMISRMEYLGANRKRLRTTMAGAAQIHDTAGPLDISRHHQLSARRTLWELGLILDDEEIGGELCRTLKLVVQSGRVSVRDSFNERELGRHSFRRH